MSATAEDHPEQKSDPHLVTHKAILMIAVPMAFGYLTVPLVSLADLGAIGQLGDAALMGGVAMGGVLISLFLKSLNFLSFGTSALTAQAFGRGDVGEQVAVLLRAAALAFSIGLIMVICQVPLFSLGMWLMQPSDAVAAATADYFYIRLWAAPFTLMNFVFMAWFLGVGRPITSFLLQTLLNGTNVILSLYFVLELEWGVRGVSAATFIAELLTVSVSIGLAFPIVAGNRIGLLERLRDKAKFFKMIQINRDILIRTLLLTFSFAFFTRQSGQISDVYLAANEILLLLFMVAGYFLDGLATAAEQFTGRAIGAARRSTFQRAVRLTTSWNVGQALFLALVFFAAGPFIIDVMAKAEDVRQIAVTYLPWAVLTPLVGVMAFQMDGVFIGASWSRDMRNTMIVSTITFVASYYVLYPLLGNHGLWLSLWILLSMRGFTLWLTMKKREQEVFG